jgi:hypothetical protein
MPHLAKKVEAYSTIHKMIDNFLENDFEKFMETDETKVSLSENDISITLDFAKFKE